MVAEASQIFLRDVHALPKLFSYEEYCRRDRWRDRYKKIAYGLLVATAAGTTGGGHLCSQRAKEPTPGTGERGYQSCNWQTFLQNMLDKRFFRSRTNLYFPNTSSSLLCIGNRLISGILLGRCGVVLPLVELSSKSHLSKPRETETILHLNFISHLHGRWKKYQKHEISYFAFYLILL
jgi:hypothetical protein